MPDYKARVSLRSHLELDYHDRDGDHIGTLRLKESTLQWFGPERQEIPFGFVGEVRQVD